MKNIYFLSDAHLGSMAIPHARQQERRLVRFLDEIKDKALSLGATVIIDNVEDVISIDTYENHKDELDNLAYELGVMSVDDAPVSDVPVKETEEIDDDAPLFADDDVIEQIQADEKADIPFWEKLDIEGEQLSLFGDPESIQSKTPDKAKSEFAPGPVVDGVQVFEALAAEIGRMLGSMLKKYGAI